jgi:hypothetical protein
MHLHSWFREASDHGKLIRKGQLVEKTRPMKRQNAAWAPIDDLPENSCHTWTDGSFRASARLGWVATTDDVENGPMIAQGSSTLRERQVAFDAEVAAILAALRWFQDNRY